ncbi:MAG: ABC transporter permease [Candidatus Methanomethylicia archaeon]
MKLKTLLAFIKWEIKRYYREKILLFWLLIWPLIWIFMTAYVFVPPTTTNQFINLNIGVINYDKSNTSFNGTTFIEILREIEYNGTKMFSISEYKTVEEAAQNLRRGILDALIIIPEDFGVKIFSVVSSVEIKVYVGAKTPQTKQITETIITSVIRGFSEEISLERVKYVLSYIPEEYRYWSETVLKNLVNPVNMSIEYILPEVFQERSRIIGWYTIGAIGMLFLYTGFSSGSTIIISEKERGTLKKLLSTPLTASEFIIGRMISLMIPMLISTIILILISISPIIGAHITFNPTNPIHILSAIFIVCGALMSISIGAIISILAKTREGAAGMGVILGLLLSFTTGIWFPIEWMPQPIRILATIFPPALSIEISRRIIVFEPPYETLLIDSIKIITSTIIFLTTAITIYKKTIQKYMEI